MSKLGKGLSLLFESPAYKAHKYRLRHDARYQDAMDRAAAERASALKALPNPNKSG